MSLHLIQVNLTDEKSWPIVAMAAVALAYIVLRPMMRRKRDPLERTPAFSSLAQQRAVERQMSNLLVDLTEMARQISAQLDTRATRLEALIREADDKLEELRAATAGPTIEGGEGCPPSRGSMRIVHDEPPAIDPLDQPAGSMAVDSRHAEVYALADEGRAAAEIAARLNRPNGEIELILALRPRA